MQRLRSDKVLKMKLQNSLKVGTSQLFLKMLIVTGLLLFLSEEVFSSSNQDLSKPYGATSYFSFNDTSEDAAITGVVEKGISLNDDPLKPRSINTGWSFVKNDSMAVSMWIKTETTKSDAPIFFTLNHQESSFFGIGFWNNSHDIVFKSGSYVEDSDQSGLWWPKAGDVLRDGEWHHLVLNKRGRSGYYHTRSADLDLYIDGMNWTDRRIRREYSHSTGTFGPMHVAGNSDAQASPEGYLNAHIDEVLIFNRSLSEEEVAAIYGRYVDETGLAQAKKEETASLYHRVLEFLKDFFS